MIKGLYRELWKVYEDHPEVNFLVSLPSTLSAGQRCNLSSGNVSYPVGLWLGDWAASDKWCSTHPHRRTVRT